MVFGGGLVIMKDNQYDFFQSAVHIFLKKPGISLSKDPHPYTLEVETGRTRLGTLYPTRKKKKGAWPM